MRAVSVAPVAAPISCGVTSAVEESSCVKFDGSDESWFADAVQVLLPKPAKQGYELHLLADWDERLCQKYAADSVKPSAYFFRRLMRSPTGRTWFFAAMDGCTEQWWLDLQSDLALAAKFKRIMQE